jgi:hypothetical protein
MTHDHSQLGWKTPSEFAFLPPAPGSGAALCRGLGASPRGYHRPSGQIQQPERTQDWIKVGGKVTGDYHSAFSSAEISQTGIARQPCSRRMGAL